MPLWRRFVPCWVWPSVFMTPHGLLGGKTDVGITCALVPRDTPGAEFGRRHFPLDAMFMNGPSRGRDVFMPIDYIIGGQVMAGQGWRMLMQCLAAGRAISLPSCHSGMAQLTVRAVGGYARVRSQFKLAVGRFEGIEEALTRIGAYTYMMNAVRKFTAGAQLTSAKNPRWPRPLPSITSPNWVVRWLLTAWMCLVARAFVSGRQTFWAGPISSCRLASPLKVPIF